MKPDKNSSFCKGGEESHGITLNVFNSSMKRAVVFRVFLSVPKTNYERVIAHAVLPFIK